MDQLATNIIQLIIQFFNITLFAIFAIDSFFCSHFISIKTEKISSQIRADSYADILQPEIAAFEELRVSRNI